MAIFNLFVYKTLKHDGLETAGQEQPLQQDFWTILLGNSLRTVHSPDAASDCPLDLFHLGKIY